MQSLFNSTENNNIIERINKLSADTKQLWGKMKVAQMLAHSQTTLLVALGEKKLKGGLMGFLFGKIAKKQLLKDAPFKQNMPTAPSFIVKDEREFDVEKNKLIQLIQKFGNANAEEIAGRPHPFFGKLTKDEWDVLQWKHLDHHLKQFGV